MMAAAAIFVLPMVMADAEQLPDIGTLLVAITAPIFGLAGAAIGFRKAQE